MKTVKSVLSLVLAMLLAFAALPATAAAASPFGEIGADPSTFPEVFDLRDVNGVSYVTPVKYQNPFATCWGFAAIASAETSILSSGLAAEMGYTVDTLDLSEKHVAYFITSTITDEDDPQYGEGLLYRYEGSEDERQPSDSFNMGGFSPYATNLFAAGTGPVLEDANEQFLYRGKDGKIFSKTYEDGDTVDYCYSADDDWSIDDDLRWTQNFVLKESYIVDLSHYDAEEPESEAAWLESVNGIKDLLYSGHAVEIGFCADVSMPDQEESTQYISENWAHFTYEETYANHAVAIIGWDDHYPKENFRHKTETWVLNDAGDKMVYGETDAPIPEHDGAWLVKNSWGSGEREFPNGGDWGLLQGQDKGVYNAKTGKYEYNAVEDAVPTGYFWLSYEDHSVDVAEALDFDLVTALEGYYIAEYDYLPVSSVYVEMHSDKVQMANVFTVDDDLPSARLDYVSCQTGVPNAKVTYDVYLLEEGAAAPTDGTRVSGATEEYRYGGFHKARLDTPVVLRGGQRFAVVVTQETEEDGEPCYSFNIQACLSEYGAEVYDYNCYGVGVINPGESMFLLEGKWIDLTDTLARAALLKEPLDVSRQMAVLDNFPIKAYLTDNSETILGISDAPKSAWYAGAVRWAAESDIISRNALFRPDAARTRAQMVEFLWRAAGSPEPTATDCPFADLKESDSFRKAVLWAVENDIVKGTSPDRFDPEGAVDRAQMAAFLYRYALTKGDGYIEAWTAPQKFADEADVPAWAGEAFRWATMNHIISGVDGRLLPGEGCSRAQAVTMLYRYFK